MAGAVAAPRMKAGPDAGYVCRCGIARWLDRQRAWWRDTTDTTASAHPDPHETADATDNTKHGHLAQKPPTKAPPVTTNPPTQPTKAPPVSPNRPTPSPKRNRRHHCQLARARVKPQTPPTQLARARVKPQAPLPARTQTRMKPQAPLSTPARKDTKPTTSCRLTSFPFTAHSLSTGLSSHGPVSTGFIFLLLRPTHLGRPFTEQPHTHDLTVMPPCCPNSSHPFVPPS